MAQLDAVEPEHLTGTRASFAQFRAVLWLRWRLVVNSLNLRGGKAELAGRLLLVPVIACLVLLPAAFAGFGAWYMAAQNMWSQLSWLFWAAFILAQLFNLNVGQPATSFDPTEFIRFPVTLGNFIVIRLCFGLLSPSNLAVSLMSAAIFAGVVLVRPELWPWVLLATVSFAAANVLFTRMVFAWIDRWLSTRRAREVVTAFALVATLGVQYLNFTCNPGLQSHRAHKVNHQRLIRAEQIFHRAQPWLRTLPPELAGEAMASARNHDEEASAVRSGLVFGYALVFLGVYAMRMRTEYRGENLSESASGIRTTPPDSPNAAASGAAFAGAVSSALPLDRHFGLQGSFLGPLLRKELLLFRRNLGLLYGVVAPTAMIFLFAGRLAVHGTSSWLLLAAVGYALLGLAPMSYNSFGMEGTGAQLYFYAPTRLRTVFLAKNLAQMLLALVEVALVLAIVSYNVGLPSPPMLLFVVLWAVASLLLSTTVGNLRSISAPKKILPGRSWNRSQSQLSVWLSIAILAGCAGFGLAAQYAGASLHSPWLSVGLIALATAGACVVYRQGLYGIEKYALERRESLFQELGKKT